MIPSRHGQLGAHQIPFLVAYLGPLLRLRIFENRVLRRIFGPKRDEVTGDWRKLHNEELNDLYCSPNIVRVVKYLGLRGKDNGGVEKTT